MVKLSSYLRPYWKAALAAPLFMLIEVMADLIGPQFYARIIDQGLSSGDMVYGIRVGVLWFACILVGVIGGIACTYFSSMASIGFGTDLRRDLFAKVQQFSFTNLNEFTTASLITRLTNDVTQVQHIVMMLLRQLVRSPLLSIGGLVMAISLNANLSLVLLFALPLLLIVLMGIMSKAFPLFTKVQTRLDGVNGVMQENLTGVRVIKAFVRADYEIRKFAKANDALRDIGMKAGRLIGFMRPTMLIIMNGTVIAVLWFGGRYVNSGTMQVGQVMAFITYITQILHALMMVAMFLMNISRAKASADRIKEVLNTEVDIETKPGASVEPVREGRLTFENVSFRYKGAGGPPVLKNISFTVEPGETIAILGSTGVGKTTLVSLIPRFYDVTEGRITLDGRDIRDMDLKELRSSIGMVLQQSILFTGTIRENLAWGDPEADDEEIIAATTAAQAHQFISSFPDGYDTMVGQRGVNLSGGQKQRLAIARALLRKPKVLIMDDSTSAIDLGTEARLQVALRKLMQETTTFVIAQRISSVMDADRIIVLEDGQIVGMGKHAELMETCPVYQDIYRSQLGKEAV
jgi:ATP-binding cassette subfamily B multidrug efflux pump